MKKREDTQKKRGKKIKESKKITLTQYFIKGT